ncbi:MAG TPA: M15 family metallopeptidase [Acidimicrobiales bacterium]|nr:M15 family metallopeptidase [Acidimicrobiales bacterium]
MGWPKALPPFLALALVVAGGCSSSQPAATAGAPIAATTTTVFEVSASTTLTSAAPSTTVAATVPAAIPTSAADLGSSWHPGCPVGPDDLAVIPIRYWGFDDQPHVGSIVIHASVAEAVDQVFSRLYADHFPIRRVEPVSAFEGDDNASMAADNTSGFNCRAAVGAGPARWSAHASGQAIDVNPRENPYLLDGEVLPPEGADYLDRTVGRPGMAVAGGPLTSAFAAVGWSWGGTWTSPDYQHFSATGA